jgi:hypothetical protein
VRTLSDHVGERIAAGLAARKSGESVGEARSSIERYLDFGNSVQRIGTTAMVVNRRTATALGLAIPPSIMLRADEVIE